MAARFGLVAALAVLVALGCSPRKPNAVEEDKSAGKPKAPSRPSTPRPTGTPLPPAPSRTPEVFSTPNFSTPKPGGTASPDAGATTKPGASATPSASPAAGAAKITYEGNFIATLFAGGKAGVPADGAGPAAILGRPTDGAQLAFEPGATSLEGFLLLADTFANQIREIKLPGGEVKRIIGATTDAGIQQSVGNATGVAYDATNKQMVWAETGNHILRRRFRDGSSSTAGSVAGVKGTSSPYRDGDGVDAADDALAIFNKPMGLAIDGTTLYVADAGSHTIRAVELARPYKVTFVAGGKGTAGKPADMAEVARADARFDAPMALALSKAGGKTTLYVADSNNHCIRAIDLSKPDGKVSVVAGGTFKAGADDGTAEAATFDTPVALAVDKDGNVYVGEKKNGRVRRIAASDKKVATISGRAEPGTAVGLRDEASYYSIAGIAVDTGATGKALYVFDAGPPELAGAEAGPRIVKLMAP